MLRFARPKPGGGRQVGRFALAAITLASAARPERAEATFGEAFATADAEAVVLLDESTLTFGVDAKTGKPYADRETVRRVRLLREGALGLARGSVGYRRGYAEVTRVEGSTALPDGRVERLKPDDVRDSATHEEWELPTPKNWKNASCFRLGGEYRFNDSWAVRLAGIYDQSPIPDSTVSPDLPDANRVVFATGVGYRYPKLGLRADLGYELVWFMERTALTSDGNPFPANYKTVAHLIGISLGLGQ
jgi:hypothetical protein